MTKNIKSNYVITSCLLVGLLSACAGREPVLRDVAKTSDEDKSCTSLHSESLNLAANARSKIEANKSRDGGDVAIGVAGALLFWPALFALDTKNADGHEGNNLVDRIEHLELIAENKKCDTSDWPQVVRYQ
tara:strand:+ start:1936 stop:2328 length:393 start_codon:yes stop_codon:yes gene_type:complete